ncbi:hypothetical protein TNCV_1836291 [Trichonephila clavipes]|nr:hypothetical protein TNCV_1836291 [Trichonephila clavipes]
MLETLHLQVGWMFLPLSKERHFKWLLVSLVRAVRTHLISCRDTSDAPGDAPSDKKLNLERPSRPNPTGDDSNVISNESFHFDVSFVMDFRPSIEEQENKDAECTFHNEKFSEDQQLKI